MLNSPLKTSFSPILAQIRKIRDYGIFSCFYLTGNNVELNNHFFHVKIHKSKLLSRYSLDFKRLGFFFYKRIMTPRKIGIFDRSYRKYQRNRGWNEVKKNYFFFSKCYIFFKTTLNSITVSFTLKYTNGSYFLEVVSISSGWRFSRR